MAVARIPMEWRPIAAWAEHSLLHGRRTCVTMGLQLLGADDLESPGNYVYVDVCVRVWCVYVCGVCVCFVCVFGCVATKCVLEND